MNAVESRVSLELGNRYLEKLDARARVAWALEHLPGAHVLSSSFGVQAAVMLHMVTREAPGIPVVLLDTGYLFAETYGFVDKLTERLDLNLKVYRSTLSPAWQEARFGRLWEQGEAGLDHYHRLNKIEPMQRALDELGATTWFAGLRRSQSPSRALIPFLEHLSDGRCKCYPLADWNDRDVWLYLKRYNLSYHPLWHEGYVSVGDTHSTRTREPGMTEEETRFLGIKRECGLHTEIG